MMRLAYVSALALFAIGSGTAAAEDEPAPLRLARYTTAAALPDPALTTPLAIVSRRRCAWRATPPPLRCRIPR